MAVAVDVAHKRSLSQPDMHALGWHLHALPQDDDKALRNEAYAWCKRLSHSSLELYRYRAESESA